MQMRYVVITLSVTLLVSLHGKAGAQSLSCDELRANVEAKIRSNGGTNFTVEAVEATAKAQGQVVGTCQRGEKKLVYLKAASATSAASQLRPAAGASPPGPSKPKTSGVITECADGRVITTGTCKKP